MAIRYNTKYTNNIVILLCNIELISVLVGMEIEIMRLILRAQYLSFKGKILVRRDIL